LKYLNRYSKIIPYPMWRRDSTLCTSCWWAYL